MINTKIVTKDEEILEVLIALKSIKDKDRDARSFLNLFQPWAEERLRILIN